MKKSVVKLFGFLALIISLTTSCGSSEYSGNSSTFVLVPNDLKGNINEGSIVLDANTVYTLTGSLVINNGASLTIPAGTRIEATGGTSAFIAVAQGGKIFINGTSTNPVVMTSGLPNPAPGNWGGLVICGKAPINRGTTASAEVSDLPYGGNFPNDSSGLIRYLRIEYSGAAFNSEKEFNGVSLFGVGSETVFEYVQVYAGADDGFEFFGGTVNTSYLVSTYNEDDQFDWTEGWTGTNIYWQGKLGLNRGNRGIEADNFESNFDATPISYPTITNLSLIGLGNQGAEPDAIKLRRGTKAVFNNVYLSNFVDGFDVEHDQTISFIPNSLKANNVTFDRIINKSKGKKSDGTSADVSTIFTETTFLATGAGNGAEKPTWSNGWTIGL